MRTVSIFLIAAVISGCGNGMVSEGPHLLAGQSLHVRTAHEYCGHTVLSTDQGILIRIDEWSATDPQSGYRKLNDEWAVAEGIALVSRDDLSCGFRLGEVL